MILIVQHIQTLWTKASRGMPQAAKRSAVPRILSVPYIEVPQNGVIIHEVNHYEFTQFQAQVNTYAADQLFTYWDLHFQTNASAIDIFFNYATHRTGLPLRGGHMRKLFTLKPKQIGAFHINGRYASYESFWYEQHCINMAYVEKLNSLVFMNRKPDFLLDQLVTLF